jgi:oligosaccharide:H+ symporter
MKIEFSFLQFFFWSTWAVYGAYLVYYLDYIGYSSMRIGTLMALRTLMGLIGPPLIGYIADKIENRKIVFMASMGFLGITVVPFPFYGDVMIALSIAMIGILWEPQQSVLDSWIIETSDELAVNYGFMRAWGSIGFALTVTIFGQVIDYFGWKIHFMGYGLIAFITVGTAYFIKDTSYENIRVSEAPQELSLQNHNSDGKEITEKGRANDKNVLRLFKNKGYIFILFVTILIFIPAMMIFVYLAPAIKAVGGDSRDLGYTLFFNALSEAPIFFTAKYFLEKYKTKPLLLFSAVFYMLRIIIAASAPSPFYFIFFGMLQSLSYGVFLVTVRYYVKLVAPEELKTTAQSIALMAGFGAGGIIGSLLGGYLIDNFGISAMYTVCISLSFLAVLTLVISIILDSNKTQTI